MAGLLVFLYWAARKEIWFCDEIYTYESANGFEQTFPAKRTDVWTNRAEVIAAFAADSDKLALKEVSSNLYGDHVPLYFWIFRMLSFWGFRGSCSTWIGLGINLFFYPFLLLSLYCFFFRLTGNIGGAGGIVVLGGIVCRLCLEQATTLRMYMLLLWAEVLLLIVCFRLIDEVRSRKLRPSTWVFLFGISVIGFLTHYDFWIFYAVSAGVFCLWLLGHVLWSMKCARWQMGQKMRGDVSTLWHCAAVWIVNSALVLVTVNALFPYWKDNLRQGNGALARKALSAPFGDVLYRLGWGYRSLSGSIFGEAVPPVIGVVLLFGVLVGGIFFLYRQKENAKGAGLVIICLITQLYQWLICLAMPSVAQERYLWGSHTIVWCCVLWCALMLLELLFPDKTPLRTVTAVFLACVVLVGEWRVIDDGRGIAYLYQPEKNKLLLQEHSGEPWLVYGATDGVYCYYDWIIPERICFLTEHQTPEDVVAVQEAGEADAFVLYVREDLYPQAADFLEQAMGEHISVDYLTASGNLKVYLVER
ncbi:MAG: hypothetical protein IJ833_01930 [Lachnospiraceae bacterium]|nr:hypothetical protein [Lachnospiraceae bacterium]